MEDLSLIRSNCSICLEKFKDPKLLPCYHTFCAVCLEKYISRTAKGEIFECPVCRKDIKVPVKGVVELQNNFYINKDDEHDERQELFRCEACDTDLPSDHRCLDCDQNFCSRCTESHAKMKVSRHHKLIVLTTDDPSLKRSAKTPSFCGKHSTKEIEAVCKDCNQCMCVFCMLTYHEGHKLREVGEEAKEIKEALTATIDQIYIEGTFTRQSRIINRLNKMKEGLKLSLEEEKRSIKVQGDCLHQKVNGVVKELENTLEREYTTTLEEIDKLIELPDTYSGSLRLLISKAHQLIEESSEVDMVQNGAVVRAKLAAVIAREPIKENNIEEIGPFYTKGGLDERLIKNMVGNVKERGIQKISTFVVGDGTSKIWDIAPTSNDLAWVCFNENKLEQIDSTGKPLLSVDVGTTVYSIAADERGNCVVCCCNDRSIKRVTTTGEIETIVSSTDGKPFGVAHRTRPYGKGEVLFSCTRTSGGGSAVFVAPYRQDAEYKLWTAGYQGVFRLAVDKTTGNVCLADYVGRRVAVHNENGDVVSTFETSNYNPFSVCFDSRGDMLITENNVSSQVRRFEPRSEFEETLAEISGFSAKISSNNCMWVGKDCGVVDIFKVLNHLNIV